MMGFPKPLLKAVLRDKANMSTLTHRKEGTTKTSYDNKAPRAKISPGARVSFVIYNENGPHKISSTELLVVPAGGDIL